MQALPRCIPTTRWGGRGDGERALPSSTPALPSSILRTSILLTSGRSAIGSGGHPPTTLHICCQVGIRTDGSVHRVDRVLSFFSSRRNWDSPAPSPALEVPPLWFRGGGATLACGRGGGGPIPTRGPTLFYQCILCGSVSRMQCSGSVSFGASMIRIRNYLYRSEAFHQQATKLRKTFFFFSFVTSS